MVMISVDVTERFALKSFELELKHLLVFCKSVFHGGVLHVLFIALYRNTPVGIFVTNMSCDS